MKPFYAAAHCTVLPSYHEGMSNVLLEAASCGRPLITSNIHGCMEAVEDGVSGYLCEAKDAQSLYRAMKQFCELPNEDRENMGLAGRQRMVELFRKDYVLSQTLKHLD